MKIESAVVEAIKGKIRVAGEILAGELVSELQIHDGYVFDQMRVLQIIRDTDELRDFVDLRKDNENRIVFGWKDELQQTAGKYHLSKIEQTTFKLIHDASENGMKSTWIRDKLKIPQREVKSVLDKLIQTKLIKKTSVGKRIMFHRSDVELDESVTGGFFYEDKRPEQELITIARQFILKYLASKVQKHVTTQTQQHAMMPILWNRSSGASAAELTKYLNNCKVFNSVCKEKDLLPVLETLRYDDLVNNFEEKNETIYYLVKNSYPEFFSYSHIPCSVCPVKTECKTGSNVNPESCEYLTNWLNDF